MPVETIVYRRAELYEQVWSEPAIVVAKRYGVSDVALAKICKKLAVPLPGRGYWARVQAGQHPKRLPLRALPEGCPEEHRGQRVIPPPVDAEVQAVTDAEANSAPIVVSDVLVDPHPLVARAAKILGRRKPQGVLVYCRDELCLNIAVAPASLDRALRIMDAALKALEARGHRVEVVNVPELHEHGARRPAEMNVTRVLVGDAPVAISLSELLLRQEKPAEPRRDSSGREYPKWMQSREFVYVATGELELKILSANYDYARCAWKDGKRQRIEKCLNAFVTGVGLAAVRVRRALEEAERSHKAYVEQERLRAEQRRLEWEEEKRVADLEKVLTAWIRARETRELIAEAHRMAADAGLRITPEHHIGQFLAWAAGYADRVDPLTPLREDIAKVVESQRQATVGSTGPADECSAGDQVNRGPSA